MLDVNPAIMGGWAYVLQEGISLNVIRLGEKSTAERDKVMNVWH